MVFGCASARKEVMPEDVVPISEEEIVSDNETGRVSKDDLMVSPALYSDYLIQAGDVFEISVWGEEEMTREIVVLPDGTISYFLVGELTATGKKHTGN